MDPNVLARAIVPRPLNNFFDNLPSEERLASDGPWTLVEPTKKLFQEVPTPLALLLPPPTRYLRASCDSTCHPPRARVLLLHLSSAS